MATATATAPPSELPKASQPDRGFWTLYVGDLDRRVAEPQLVELFSTYGPILSARVIRDIVTRASLGYGYVNFQNQADAEKALKELNFHELNGKQIRLMWQQRDPSSRYSGSGNLFVKNLPSNIDHKALHEMFKAFGDILSCKVIKDPETGKSRNYGFVHFQEENGASKALTTLNGKKVDGTAEDGEELKALYVANFIKRNARIAALVANFTNVYIKQVLPNVTQADVERFFAKFGGIASAVTKTDKRGRVFAFCDFKSHDAAVKAIQAANEKKIDGLSDDTGMYVARAQSRSERLIELRQLYMQRQALGNNLYVRNFGAEVTSDDLKDLFKGFGEITSARVMADDEGNSRGFGFLSFAQTEHANHALKEMNGRMLNGKPLVVNIAQRRDQRTSMLQVQFQQRLQALLTRMPMGPIIAPHGAPSSRPPTGMRSTRGTKAAPSRGPASAVSGAPATRRPQPEVVVHVDGSSSVVTPGAHPELGHISAEALMLLDEESRKEALGERLFVKVHAADPELAPKITGMFLEMPPLEAHALLENPTLLQEKIREAVTILRGQ
jgi:polyadenylate-binding protein